MKPGPPLIRSARSLQGEFRRLHLTLVLGAIVLAGGLLTAVAWAGLRSQAQQNLALIARTVAYTVEAALVFHDPEAANEALATVATQEQLTELSIVDAQGRSFARWQRPGQGWQSRLAEWLWPQSLEMPLARDGMPLGRLRLQGDGVGLTHFMLTVLAVMVLCLGLSAALALAMGRRMLVRITGPLRTMAEVAHAVRHERDMQRRVPPASVAELSDFGDDFNALLEELAQREAALRRENAHLAHQADHDTLTGLPNRAAFARALDASLALARACGGGLAVLFVDCDRFKPINDTRGHAVGDVVLCEIGRRLRAQVRDSDMVARLGGDEFAVMVAPLRDAAQARRIAEALARAMIEPVAVPEGAPLAVSVSVGMAMYPEDGSSVPELLARADGAMYHVKRQRARAA
jgi:diguanylate cyclase (GGDEF)-like protein